MLSCRGPLRRARLMFRWGILRTLPRNCVWSTVLLRAPRGTARSRPPARSHHGARAGVATDAGVAARIQRMAWDVVAADVVFDLFGCPVGERADLDRRGGQIHLTDVGARVVLRAAQSHGPGFQLFELAVQRAH